MKRWQTFPCLQPFGREDSLSKDYVRAANHEPYNKILRAVPEHPGR